MFYSANGKFTKKSIKEKEDFLNVFHGYVHKHDETELDKIKSDINDVKDKADDLSKEVKSSKRNFYGLYSKVSDFDQKFDDIDKIQDEIDQKFSYLDEVHDEIDQKFSYLDEVQDEIDQKFNSNDSKMVVTGSGNVGIGETNPENILHVRGNGPQLLLEGDLNENAIMRFSSGPSYSDKYHEIENEFYAIGGHATKNKMHFKVNNGGETNSPGTRMTIRGDGNVGIGTNNPAYKLDVNGDIRIPQAYSSTDPENPDAGKSNKLLFYSNPGFGEAGINYVGGRSGAEQSESYLNLFTSGSSKMAIKDNGNVGIGTTRPLSKLQVGSTGYIRKDHGTYGTNDAVTIAIPKATSNSVLNDPQDALILTRPGTTNQAWQSQAHMRLSRYENSGTNSRTRLDLGLLHNSGGTDQQDGAAPDNVMTLLSNGNVGVGNTAPSSTLDVNGSFKAKSINPFEGNPSGKYYSRWSVGGVAKRIYHFVCYFKVDHRNIQTRLEIDFSMAYFRSKTGSHNRNQRSAGKVVLNIASNCPSNKGDPESNRSDMKWFINYSSHGTHYVVSGQMGTGPGFYFLRKNDSCYILAAMGQTRSDGGSYNAMFKVSIMDPFLKEFRMFTDNATMKKNANIEPHLGEQSDPSNHKPDNYNSDFPGEYNFTNDDYGTWIKINGEGTKYQSFDDKLTNQTLG